jgi:hypothetical protein
MLADSRQRIVVSMCARSAQIARSLSGLQDSARQFVPFAEKRGEHETGHAAVTYLCQ